MKQKKVTATITNTVVNVFAYDKTNKEEKMIDITLHTTFKSQKGLIEAVQQCLASMNLILVEILSFCKVPTTYEMDTSEFIRLAHIKEQ